MLEEKDGYFLIEVYVSRADLESVGVEADKVTDAEMSTLAQKMADAYVDSIYWNDLETLAHCIDFEYQEEED